MVHLYFETYGRRYEIELSSEYSHEADYNLLAGEIKAEINLGLFKIAGKLSIHRENSSSKSSLRMKIYSNAYGFSEITSLTFPTESEMCAAKTPPYFYFIG